MNNRPSISVIVPVYRAETYLYKCVESLLAQTYHDFEILLIDDGSPDKSGILCDEYAAKNDRIRVFHKVNGGVSSARQYGLDNARGEYVIYADPDDWVEPDMLEELYKIAKTANADVVICDYYVESNKKTRYINQRPSALTSTAVLCGLFQELHGSSCNKLVKRVCYKENKISFPLDLSFCEDLYVNTALFLTDISVAYCNRAFYHYVQGVNENSIVHTLSRTDFEYCKRMSAKFVLLTGGSVCEELCKVRMAWLIVFRAFEGHYFSSSEFKEQCMQYKHLVLKNRIAALWLRLCLYFSCIGFYRYAYLLYQLRNRIRK